MFLTVGLDNIKDGHIKHQKTQIKVINFINSITSLTKRPRWVLNPFCLGSKCLEMYRRLLATLWVPKEFYYTTWEVLERYLGMRQKTDIFIIETKTSTHLTDTPEGYHFILTLLTNRRKLTW